MQPVNGSYANFDHHLDKRVPWPAPSMRPIAPLSARLALPMTPSIPWTRGVAVAGYFRPKSMASVVPWGVLARSRRICPLGLLHPSRRASSKITAVPLKSVTRSSSQSHHSLTSWSYPEPTFQHRHVQSQSGLKQGSCQGDIELLFCFADAVSI